jgi:hypothetical protein
MPKGGYNYITYLNYRVILTNPLIKGVFSSGYGKKRIRSIQLGVYR